MSNEFDVNFQAIKAKNERKRDAAALATKERREEWEARFFASPLPSTPAELLAVCQQLRFDLDESADANQLVANARSVQEWLWRAMRAIGGSVPKLHALTDCEESEAFLDALRDGERRPDLHLSIDAVVAWCKQSVALLSPTHETLDLSQIAAYVHMKKRSMDAYKRRKDDPLPDADYPGGGGGRKDYWKWTTIRPWLVRNFRFHISEQFPDVYRRR